MMCLASLPRNSATVPALLVGGWQRLLLNAWSDTDKYLVAQGQPALHDGSDICRGKFGNTGAVRVEMIGRLPLMGYFRQQCCQLPVLRDPSQQLPFQLFACQL